MVTKMIKILLIIVVCIALALGIYFITKKAKKTKNFASITSYDDIKSLFPTTENEIKRLTEQAINDAKKTVAAIIAVNPHEKNLTNTLIPFDHLCALSDLSILRSSFGALELVSTQESVRTAAHNAVQQINNFWVDTIENNHALYSALKIYAAGDTTSLTDEQRYFLIKTLEDYKRGGLELPQSDRDRVAQLKKDLAKLSQDFELAIASDNRTITVKKEDLLGLKEEFIATLQPAPQGEYKVGVDYPTYFEVMENCTVADTRKKLYESFNNRAYPINENNLMLVIAKRDELAHILGFSSYDHLDLDDQMVKTPEHAEQFLDSLLARGFIKDQQEYESLVRELPEGIMLNKDGTFNAWDIPFVKADYKKKHFSVDETEIANYFPMQKTIDALLDIYHQFFSIDFKQVNAYGLWHSDVQLIEVYDRQNKILLGYLLLDLYPRLNKFSHACQITLVPSIVTHDNKKPPAVSLVIANFPKPTSNKPSLLKRDDVRTFFHEFGHALHALLGRTSVASFSGTSVKSDFVEMPSQMLEEWLWDPAILRKVSSHYKTGEALPDYLINQILALKHFDSGFWVIRQVALSKLSLAYFKNGAKKNIYEIMQNLFVRTMPHVAFDQKNHMYASFGHLMGYGAKYYGYLWSKVFALDLFNEIKKYGLLNPEIGKKYINDVIGKGGTQDPNILLRNFLGREPNEEAFFKDLGL